MSDEDMKFVGGWLCLDFVNTTDAWASTPGQRRDYGDTPLREKLVDYRALVRWGQLADALSASAADSLDTLVLHPAAALTLHRALQLRQTLYRLFKCVVQTWEPEDGDLRLLHQELRVARMRERLIYHSHSHSGALHRSWDESPGAFDRMLWPVVVSAVELLTAADLSRLRQCKAEECGWMFLDSSRNHSRHWCDMNDCGNLDKVRRFRKRNDDNALATPQKTGAKPESKPRRTR